MRKITVTINDIKAIKKLMDDVDVLKEKNLRLLDDGKEDYNGKEKIIKYHEGKVEKNIKTTALILGIDYNIVIDMCYDLVFCKYVLNDLKTNSIKK